MAIAQEGDGVWREGRRYIKYKKYIPPKYLKMLANNFGIMNLGVLNLGVLNVCNVQQGDHIIAQPH